MIVLDVHNHKTFIKNADSNDLELIKKALTVFKQKFQVSIYSESKWDITYLLSYKDFSFPTAFLSEIKDYCNDNGIALDITDSRKFKYSYLHKLFIKKQLDLRIDQKEALEAIKEFNTGIISMPTASGKSRVIAKTLEFRKVRTLIAVPTSNLQHSMLMMCQKLFGKSRVDTEVPIDLIEKMKRGLIETEGDVKNDFKGQKIKEDFYSDFKKKTVALDSKKEKSDLYSDFKKKTTDTEEKDDGYSDFKKKVEYSPEDRFVKDKKKENFKKMIERQKQYKQKQLDAPVKYKDIYIFCNASLKNLPQEFINQFDMIIVDEAHHSSSDELRSFLLKAKNAGYRYFFTATPWRDHSADQKLLMSAIGSKIIYELSPERAIELGSIAKPVYLQIPCAKPDQYIPQTKKWRDILNFGIIGNKSRNKQIVDLAIKEFNNGENVFISVDEVTHIEILRDRFKERGIEVDIIHGRLNKKDNNKTIDMVGERKTGISLGTMSVGEGTDMPNLSVIILASGGKSSIRLIQRIGRGARLGIEQNKRTFKVYDFFDMIHPTLMAHSIKRKSIYIDYFSSWGQ